MSFLCTHFGKLQINKKYQVEVLKTSFFMIFDTLKNNIFPV